MRNQLPFLNVVYTFAIASRALAVKFPGGIIRVMASPVTKMVGFLEMTGSTNGSAALLPDGYCISLVKVAETSGRKK